MLSMHAFEMGEAGDAGATFAWRCLSYSVQLKQAASCGRVYLFSESNQWVNEVGDQCVGCL